MIGRRVLIEEGGQVHDAGAMVASVSVESSDFRPDSADHEIFEDSGHRDAGSGEGF